jgi:hypothetical protein
LVGFEGFGMTLCAVVARLVADIAVHKCIKWVDNVPKADGAQAVMRVKALAGAGLSM